MQNNNNKTRRHKFPYYNQIFINRKSDILFFVTGPEVLSPVLDKITLLIKHYEKRNFDDSLKVLYLFTCSLPSKFNLIPSGNFIIPKNVKKPITVLDSNKPSVNINE